MKTKNIGLKKTSTQSLDPLFFELARLRKDGKLEEALNVRNDLILKNRGLVYQQVNKIVRQQKTRGVEFEELIAIATEGLCKAVDKFDPSRPNSFSSYAVPYIFGEVQRYFRDRAFLIKLPQRHQNHIKWFKQYVAKSTERNMKTLLEGYSKQHNMSVDSLVQILEDGEQFYFYSLEAAHQEDESGYISEEALIVEQKPYIDMKSLKPLSWFDIKGERGRRLRKKLNKGWLSILSQCKTPEEKEEDPLFVQQLALF